MPKSAKGERKKEKGISALRKNPMDEVLQAQTRMSCPKERHKTVLGL